jgi:hypothetical protein
MNRKQTPKQLLSIYNFIFSCLFMATTHVVSLINHLITNYLVIYSSKVCPLYSGFPSPKTKFRHLSVSLQHTDQEMIPARNARNVVTLVEVMFVTIQRENILPSKITDY